MQALGFDTCDLAANGQDAFLRAMENPPDIVLMDVNLEGAAKGSKLPDGFAKWATCPSSSSLHIPTTIPSSVSTNRCRAPVIAKTLYRERLPSVRAGGTGILVVNSK